MYDDSMIIGEPDSQQEYWELQIAPDNCAVAAEMSIINQFGHDLSQQEANFISADHGWYNPGGGTNPGDIGNMMDLYNISNHTCVNASIEELAAELKAGHGVIVGVNSSELWDTGLLAELKHFLCKAFGLDNSIWNPADHAVVVTGIDASDPDNPMVILNDSGHPDGAGAAYPLDKFMDAWENSDFYYTATDDAMPHNDMDSINLLDFGKWFAAGAAGGYVLVSTGDIGGAIAAGEAAYDFVGDLFGDPEIINMV